MPSCATAKPAARRVLRARAFTVRRAVLAAASGRLDLAGPDAGLVSRFLAMGERVLAPYDTTVRRSFRHNPAYPPLRLIHVSASRHPGKTWPTHAQNLWEWFISRRCMSSWWIM